MKYLSFGLFKKAYLKWSADNAPRMGAALAYYTVFSLSPLLILALGIAAAVFGKEAVEGELGRQIQAYMGKEAAQATQSLLASAYSHSSTASIVGIAILCIGASGVLVELRSALNKVWEVPPANGSSVWLFIKERLISFAMILSIGFLMLVSLLVNTILAAAARFVGDFFSVKELLLQTVAFVGSFVMVTLLFALIFKILPDTKVRWSEVWVGSVITALLFSIGKIGVTLYLSKTAFSTAFGAAGSIVLILFWAYYSAQILFFGAEYTRVSAELNRQRVVA